MLARTYVARMHGIRTSTYNIRLAVGMVYYSRHRPRTKLAFTEVKANYYHIAVKAATVAVAKDTADIAYLLHNTPTEGSTRVTLL